MQNSTETASTSAAQKTQYRAGKGCLTEADSSCGEVDGREIARPNPRRSKIGTKAISASASRQPPGNGTHQPTINGAAVLTSEAITFASDMATTRCSWCRSESSDGTITRISEPIKPMLNAAPTVTSAD